MTAFVLLARRSADFPRNLPYSRETRRMMSSHAHLPRGGAPGERWVPSLINRGDSGLSVPLGVFQACASHVSPQGGCGGAESPAHSHALHPGSSTQGHRRRTCLSWGHWPLTRGSLCDEQIEVARASSCVDISAWRGLAGLAGHSPWALGPFLSPVRLCPYSLCGLQTLLYPLAPGCPLRSWDSRQSADPGRALHLHVACPQSP